MILEKYTIYRGDDEYAAPLGTIILKGGSTAYTQGELKHKIINWLVLNNKSTGWYFAAAVVSEDVVVYATEPVYFVRH